MMNNNVDTPDTRCKIEYFFAGTWRTVLDENDKIAVFANKDDAYKVVGEAFSDELKNEDEIRIVGL